jgi:hypothetical protein
VTCQAHNSSTKFQTTTTVRQGDQRVVGLAIRRFAISPIGPLVEMAGSRMRKTVPFWSSVRRQFLGQGERVSGSSGL